VAKNFHSKPFDEGTRIKLDLFGDYIREWLPVWILRAEPGVPITIADFFAGPGRDANGLAGSPLIALAQIRESADLIHQNRATIRLELNELAKRKAAILEDVMRSEGIPSDLCEYRVRSLDFQAAFDDLYPNLRTGPNLLILDQQGMKAMSDAVFKRIIALRRTDFLFFIASSSIRRFVDHPYFQNHLRIPSGHISSSTFNDTHRAVTRYYRQLAGDDRSLFLGNFAIKKGSNIYGLIFGSRHPFGLEKFLRVCWKTDPDRGEANFDIDDDRLDSRIPHLFPEMDQPKKLSVFEAALRSKILDGAMKTDGEVYVESLQEGFLPAHGKTVLRDLIREGRIMVVGGQPRVSKNGYAEPHRLKVIPNGAV